MDSKISIVNRFIFLVAGANFLPGTRIAAFLSSSTSFNDITSEKSNPRRLYGRVLPGIPVYAKIQTGDMA